MELLSELIYILNRNSAGSPGDILPKGSKARKLFNIISKSKALSDEDAAKIIYKGSYKDKKYLMLKRNLVRSLSEFVFEVNTFDKEQMNYHKFIFSAKKELMTAEKLLNLNVYHNAEKMILRVKAFAEKFQILEIQITSVKLLRTLYTLKGSSKEVEFYNAELTKLNTFFIYELEATGNLNILESKLKYTIGKYKEIAEEAYQYLLKIREWQKASSNPTLNLICLKIGLICSYHSNDTEEWLLTLLKLDDLIDLYPIFKTDSHKLYMNVEWAKYYRTTANIREASKYIDKALEQSEYAAFNKFEVQALNFDIKIKDENYEQAGKILKEVKKCHQFYLLEAPDKAAWVLREAYLYFILLTINDIPGIEKYTPTFAANSSVSNLANTCKAISKDKKGYNYMLVVIKDVLMQYKYPSHTESIGDNLMVYHQRYLKDSVEERSKYFLKIFANAARLNFSYKNNVNEKKKTKTGLMAKTFDAAEIIPYERLFDHLKI